MLTDTAKRDKEARLGDDCREDLSRDTDNKGHDALRQDSGSDVDCIISSYPLRIISSMYCDSLGDHPNTNWNQVEYCS